MVSRGGREGKHFYNGVRGGHFGKRDVNTAIFLMEGGSIANVSEIRGAVLSGRKAELAS